MFLANGEAESQRGTNRLLIETGESIEQGPREIDGWAEIGVRRLIVDQIRFGHLKRGD